MWWSRIRKKREVVGSVVDGAIDTWYPAQPDNPLRYRGKVFVVVGPGTYSSAVVFSNVMQDLRFGVVAGVGDSVRANLSGGVRRTTLTHTYLSVCTTSTRSLCAAITASMSLYAAGVSSMHLRVLAALDVRRGARDARPA